MDDVKSISVFDSFQPICQDVARDKYFLKTPAGVLRENSHNDVISRVVGAVCRDETPEFKLKVMGYMRDAILVPGGRILAGAGSGNKVTLFNCLGGDERLFTAEYGLVRLADHVGEIVTVLTLHGFSKGRISHFGRQQTQIVTLAPRVGGKTKTRSQLRHRIIATPGHRWVLRDGAVTTDLHTGDVVRAASAKPKCDNAAYRFGFMHGFVFGDGSAQRTTLREVSGGYPLATQHFTVRLCGEKNKYVGLFANVSYPPSFGGDAQAAVHTETDLKSVPSTTEVEHIAGFIDGWLAADGYRPAVGSPMITGSDPAAMDWLVDHAPMAGLIATGRRVISDSESGYANRKAPCEAVTLARAQDVDWTVENIEPHDERDVYCATVPGAQAFTLAGGIYTGNCYVMDRIRDDLADIFRVLGESALTMQQGGGIGVDFSSLRPKGADLVRTGSTASGPLPFMDTWDAMCRTIMSAGHRRGAMMGTMRCLSGDTKVHTTSGKIAIRDLVGQRPYVYACDSASRQVKIVQADKVFVSDRNRLMLRVHLDDFETVDCTPDHRFMLSDGTYRMARDLRRGDSLMAIEHSIRKGATDGRYDRYVGCTGGRRQRDSRIVAMSIHGAGQDYDWHAHHVDEDTCNNDPRNVEVLSRSEHAKEHSSNLAQHRERIAASRRGRTLEEVYGKEKAGQWKARYRAARNHKVVSVEPIGMASEVFDLSLPTLHNFAANGVFVHNCDHPDIEAFIEAKQAKGRMSMFNLSVLVTDSFMSNVQADASWPLVFGGKVYREVRARELWHKILRCTYATGEPGVIFIDRHNKMNNLAYCEEIIATNPCGEQGLPAYGNCNLGAINLAQLVLGAWTPEAEIDMETLFDVVHCAVRFHDNVIDVSGYPLPELEREAKAKRRIGLGVMGLANMLQQMGVRYGSEESVRVVQSVMSLIAEVAYDASADLAAQRGPFDLYQPDHFWRRPFVEALPDSVREKIANNGIRNGVLLTVAPTGTTGIWAGNVSGGIEPVFAHRYTRQVLQPDGSRKPEQVYDWGFLEWCRHKQILPGDVTAVEQYLPDYMVTAQDLTVADHIAVMAAAQEHVDAAISKTVNCPADMTFEAFGDVYRDAFDKGLKSCATYRPNDITGSVLEVTPKEAIPQQPKETDHALMRHALWQRPRKLEGATYKVKPGEHALYITITDRAPGEPAEVFITTKDASLHDWTQTVGRLLSAMMRNGIDVGGFVVEELQQVHSAKGGWFEGGRYYASVPAALGAILAEHIGSLAEPVSDTIEYVANGKACPKCQQHEVFRSGSCDTCRACGWSTCG